MTTPEEFEQWRQKNARRLSGHEYIEQAAKMLGLIASYSTMIRFNKLFCS